MKTVEKNMRSTPPRYVKIRQQLIRYADRRRFPDGWLPPERELCVELGVSRGTLRKAMEELIAAGRIVRVRPKGNYIVAVARRTTIGLVMGNGTMENAVVPSPDVLAGLLQTLGVADCVVRILLPRGIDRIEETFLRHELAGFVWFGPPTSALSIIAEMSVSDIPFVAFAPHLRSSIESVGTPRVVAFDSAQCGRDRANHFLDRGHRRIAYLGDASDAISYKSFVTALKQAGIDHDPKDHVPEINQIPERLPELLDQGVTAIGSNGGSERIETLLNTLESHPNGRSVDLLVDQVITLPDIARRHPNVPISAVNVIPRHQLGVAAGEALLKQINGTPIDASILIPTRIQHFNEFLETSAIQVKK